MSNWTHISDIHSYNVFLNWEIITCFAATHNFDQCFDQIVEVQTSSPGEVISITGKTDGD